MSYRSEWLSGFSKNALIPTARPNVWYDAGFGDICRVCHIFPVEFKIVEDPQVF